MILPYLNFNGGRQDYKSLKNYYEGIGVTGNVILKAQENMYSMFLQVIVNPIGFGRISIKFDSFICRFWSTLGQ